MNIFIIIIITLAIIVGVEGFQISKLIQLKTKLENEKEELVQALDTLQNKYNLINLRLEEANNKISNLKFSYYHALKNNTALKETMED